MAGERQNLHLAGGQDPIWRLWSQLPGPWRGPVIGDDVEGWESITENDDYRINLTGLPGVIQAELAWMAHWQAADGTRSSVLAISQLANILRRAISEDRPFPPSIRQMDWETAAALQAWFYASRWGRFPPHGVRARLRVVFRFARTALIAACHGGHWWELDYWHPRCDQRIPLSEREPQAHYGCSPALITHRWLREAVKWYLGTMLESGALRWTTVSQEKLRCLHRFDRWLAIASGDPREVLADPATTANQAAAFRRWDADPANRTDGGKHRRVPGKVHPRLINDDLRAVAELFAFMDANQAEARRILGPLATPWTTVTDAHAACWLRQVSRIPHERALNDGNYVDDHALAQITAAPADDPHQPRPLVIIDLPHPQPFSHRPSFDDQHPPEQRLAAPQPSRLRAKVTGDGMGEPARIALKRPALGEDEPFVGVDRQVVPQHVADLAEADPVAELAGFEQVAAQHRHAGQALAGQLRPDRGKGVVDVPAVADEDLDLRGACLALRQALGVHCDLAPHLGLVPHRLHRRAFGDWYRCVVTGDHQVEHGLGQRSLGAEALVDAFRRDAGVRGDRGDRRGPEPVPLEQVTGRQHYGQAPGTGLLAPPGRVVGPLDFRHRPLHNLDTVQLYLIGVVMTTTSPAVSANPVSVAVRAIHAVADGDRADFGPLYHPRAVDRDNSAQPPSSRVPGPAGVYATALWLRAAFAGLHYDIHHAIADATLVAVDSTMNGRHVAPWAVYTDDGVVDTVFPPTHKTFAMTQSHWFRIEDGQITEHWSNRDDLGMARQLGWIPPTPAYLFKMARAKRRAKRP